MSQREPKHRPIHFDDDQDRDRFRRRYKRTRDCEASTPDDVDDPAEWFETIIENQILPHVDTGASELQLSDKDLSAVDTRWFRLRLQHPDTCVSDVSVPYDAGEFEAYLRGLQHGAQGKISRKSYDDDEVDQ